MSNVYAVPMYVRETATVYVMADSTEEAARIVDSEEYDYDCEEKMDFHYSYDGYWKRDCGYAPEIIDGVSPLRCINYFETPEVNDHKTD